MKTTILFSLIFVSQTLFAQITGSVKSTDLDCQKPTEVFVSQGQTLLYQIPVPLNGTFEVYLNKGSYKFVAGNEKGCLSEKDVKFEGKPIHLDMNLQMPRRTPSSSGVNWSTVCYECLYASQMNLYPMGYFNNFYNPWWQNYSMMSYQNAMYPCGWGGWGCQSSYYPHHGSFAVGKPNIYVRGADVKQATMSLQKVELHKMLATSPMHLQKGWTFELKNNQFLVEKAVYPYLFYDTRAVEDKLQKEKGFCGSRSLVLERTAESLKKMDYPEQAIKDFNEYWAHRFPALERFCLYPQDTDKMNENFPIQTSLKNAAWTRVLFVVIPVVGKIPGNFKKWVEGPKFQWMPALVNRAVAGTESHHFYEWGVAFPMQE